MNPQAPNPSPADDRPVSDTARRIGPPLAVGSVVVMVALLVWLGLAPTAIAGPLTAAPFTVPGTLLVGPDDGGCLQLVAGDGGTTSHCLEELAGDDHDHRWIEVSFGGDGDIRVGIDTDTGQTILRVDADTGEVLERQDHEFDDRGGFRDRPEEHPDGVDSPPPPDVWVDGDRVLLGNPETRSPSEGELVLDLDGPPGYQLHGATLSLDEAWVVVLTADDRVVVAPTDGSAAPYVWAEVPADTWVDLWSAIRWDG